MQAFFSKKKKGKHREKSIEMKLINLRVSSKGNRNFFIQFLGFMSVYSNSQLHFNTSF